MEIYCKERQWNIVSLQSQTYNERFKLAKKTNTIPVNSYILELWIMMIFGWRFFEMPWKESLFKIENGVDLTKG